MWGGAETSSVSKATIEGSSTMNFVLRIEQDDAHSHFPKFQLMPTLEGSRSELLEITFQDQEQDVVEFAF